MRYYGSLKVIGQGTSKVYHHYLFTDHIKAGAKFTDLSLQIPQYRQMQRISISKPEMKIEIKT